MSKPLKGKTYFIAGIGDDQGFGWAIAKSLFAHGAEVIAGTWVPVYTIFKTSLERGKFDTSRKIDDQTLLTFKDIIPIDASFDHPDQLPEEVKNNKRYAAHTEYTISEFATKIEREHGAIDGFIHCLANGPEAKNPLLKTSRDGYLAAINASSYSLVSMVQHLGPILKSGGSVISLTYRASESVIPGYGGGLSSAKAALESDTRTLAYEAGREWKIRVNTISAGTLKSRAAKAIGTTENANGDKVTFIEQMIEYSEKNAPIQDPLTAEAVADTAYFLASDLSRAVTGSIIYADNGIHAMGTAVENLVL